MQTTAKTRRNDVPTALAASSRFKGFAPETDQPLREAHVEKDAKLEELLAMIRSIKLESRWDSRELYKRIEPSTRGHHFSSNDIAKFSLALAECAGEVQFDVKAGLLLSALMNNCQDERFSIFTSQLERHPSFLGFRNTKHVEVNGPLSGDAGYWMESGSLLVKGDVKGDAGYGIAGGSIIVEGDVWGGTGSCMHGGRIEVKGNASGTVGDWMEGGEITLWKKYVDIGVNYMRGKIYHEGKLIAG